MSELDDLIQRLAEQSQGFGDTGDDDDLIIDAELVEEELSGSAAESLPLTAASSDSRPLIGGVDYADERMEDRMRGVFEHDLGALGERTPSAAESTLDPDPIAARPIRSGADLVAMLRTPQTLRNLIVLSEILERPDRW